MRYFETGFRLKQADKDALLAQGLYVYERRDCGDETTIEPHVAVNFLGTIITNAPIAFKKRGPGAYVIFDGDAYLRRRRAKQVYRRDEL